MRTYLQTTYGFSNYQIAQLEYFFRALFSEISKFVLLRLFFYKQPGLFYFGMILMLSLRTTSGGLHCRHYLSCFLLSFSYLFLAIRILPGMPCNRLALCPAAPLLLLACACLIYITGPVSADGHLQLSPAVLKQMRLHGLLLSLIITVLLKLLPDRSTASVGFWVILLHTAQLITAKLLQKRRCTQ